MGQMRRTPPEGAPRQRQVLEKTMVYGDAPDQDSHADSHAQLLGNVLSDLRQPADQRHRAEPDRLGEGQEFDHMERPPPGFHPGNPGLRYAHALGDVDLLQPLGLPLRPKPLGQTLVRFGRNRLHLTMMLSGATICEI